MLTPTTQYHFGSGDNVAGDKYVQYITQIIGHYYMELEISEDEMYKQIQTYCDLLVREHSYFPMLGTNKPLEIEKVFVTLSVASGNLSGEKSTLGTDGLSSNKELLSDVSPRRDLGSPHRLFWNNGVPLNSILFHNKSVVLGEPGIGKTTLLRRMLINICKGRVLTSFVPVFISLADVNFSDVGFIYDYINRKYRECYHLIEHCIIKGKAIIFFDGLDEIDKKHQDILSEACNTLAAKGNKVVVSCRTTVFPRNLLSSDFKIFECIGFSVAQRRKFLRKWFTDRLDVSLRIERIVQENPSVWGMTRNPLLLSLIAIQFENNVDFVLPPKRIELFLQGIDELLRRRCALTDLHISFADKRNLMQYIAFHMFFSGKEIVDREELSEYVTIWLSKGSDALAKRHTSDDIIEHVIEIDGIITRYAKDQYRFSHLTFQESLTARYIFGNRNWLHFFNSKQHIPRWEETLRLLASQLNEESAKKLARLLYHRCCLAQNSGETLCMSARYLSELSMQDSKFRDRIFHKLASCLLMDKYPEMYNDVVVAFSEMCNAGKKYIQWYIGINEKNFSDSHLGWINTYIQVLKLSHSSEATNALLKLLSFIMSVKFDNEYKVVLIGNIISALENTCDYNLWKKLYQMFMDKDCSYLSAVLSKSLANILPLGLDEILREKSREESSFISSLCQYVAFKYEDETKVAATLKDILERDNIYLHQLVPYISDMDIQIDGETINAIIASCSEDRRLAIFLSLQFIFFSYDNPNFFREIISDTERSFELRYAALENFLIINASRNDEIEMILNVLNDSNLTERIPLITRVLEQANISILFDYAIKETDANSSSKHLVSLLRLLTKVSYKPSVNWLVSVFNNSDKNTDVYLYALLALCKQKYDGIQSLLLSGLQNENISVREKAILIKALLLQNNSETNKLVIKTLEQERDINLIGLIIDMLPSVINSDIEKALLQYLDFGKWPRKWPEPLPELKKGEQRQSDRRKLSIVIAASNLRSKKAMTLMKRIANDKKESSDVRHAAFVAYKNMAWIY